MDLLKFALALLTITILAQCAEPSGAETTTTEDQPAKPAFTLPDGRTPNDTLRAVNKLKINRSRNNGNTYYIGETPYTGTAIQFAKDKKSYIEYRIKEGEMVKLLGYFSDGKMERDFSFKDGKSHGTMYMYYPHGTLYVIENYNMGLLDGEQKRWYKNGKLWRKANYKNGKLIDEELHPRY